MISGEKLDYMVRCYITKMRERGGIVNTKVVKAGARGILMAVLLCYQHHGQSPYS